MNMPHVRVCLSMSLDSLAFYFRQINCSFHFIVIPSSLLVVIRFLWVRLFSRGSQSWALAGHNLVHLWRRPKPVLLKVWLRCREEERRNPPSTSASIFLTVGGGEREKRGELRSLNPVWPLFRRQKILIRPSLCLFLIPPLTTFSCLQTVRAAATGQP